MMRFGFGFTLLKPVSAVVIRVSLIGTYGWGVGVGVAGLITRQLGTKRRTPNVAYPEIRLNDVGDGTQSCSIWVVALGSSSGWVCQKTRPTIQRMVLRMLMFRPCLRIRDREAHGHCTTPTCMHRRHHDHRLHFKFQR
jgi:hypothetical protein